MSLTVTIISEGVSFLMFDSQVIPQIPVAECASPAAPSRALLRQSFTEALKAEQEKHGPSWSFEKAVNSLNDSLRDVKNKVRLLLQSTLIEDEFCSSECDSLVSLAHVVS